LQGNITYPGCEHLVIEVLASAGLVHDVKVGRERFWAFEPAHFDEARRALEAISSQWDQALLRLKAAVEE